MGLIRPDRTKVAPRFLLYQYLSPAYQDFLSSRTIHGSTVDRLLLTEFPSFEIQTPPLKEQQAIASLLGALDDKIDLNRRMNETLEAMARAIFKDWFVDFGPTRAKAEGRPPYLAPDLWSLFPAALDDEDKPVGWRIAKVEDIAEKIAMGPFGSNIKVETFVDEGVPIVSGQHLDETMLLDSEYNYIELAHAERLKNSNVYRADIIFTHAGNIGQVSYIPESSRYTRYIISQRQFYLRCRPDLISHLFMIYFFLSPEG
jgi:type I restriction enzyme, S subunit